jgi:hypothetical protein
MCRLSYASGGAATSACNVCGATTVLAGTDGCVTHTTPSSLIPNPLSCECSHGVGARSRTSGAATCLGGQTPAFVYSSRWSRMVLASACRSVQCAGRLPSPWRSARKGRNAGCGMRYAELPRRSDDVVCGHTHQYRPRSLAVQSIRTKRNGLTQCER